MNTLCTHYEHPMCALWTPYEAIMNISTRAYIHMHTSAFSKGRKLTQAYIQIHTKDIYRYIQVHSQKWVPEHIIRYTQSIYADTLIAGSLHFFRTKKSKDWSANVRLLILPQVLRFGLVKPVVISVIFLSWKNVGFRRSTYKCILKSEY